LTREDVTAIAACVRPWNPWRNAMIAGRPVATFASLIAPSVASAPLLVQKTWFRFGAVVSVKSFAACSIGEWARILAWA
jgi:hypothetical protein